MKIFSKNLAHFVAGILLLVPLFFILHSSFAPVVHAQDNPDESNPNSSSFRFVVCDGPAIPQNLMQTLTANGTIKKGYVPCNFAGLMKQVQRLITVMMILGVFAAILSFVYAGYIYITGGYNDKSKAKEIFMKVLVGFIIMLSAWFIVYQLVNWLTGSNSAYTKLLGQP